MSKRAEKSELDPLGELNHELYTLGVKAYKAEQYSKAKNYFVESLEFWPEDHLAWFALGNCYDELNKPAKAGKCYLAGLEFTDERKIADFRYNLGNSLFDQKKYEEAIEQYSKVSKKSSAWAPASINLALSKSKLE